jgi:transposase-like protein
LRGLLKRGLVGVQLAISDAHAGLKAAIAKVLGCAWQRCTVHFLRRRGYLSAGSISVALADRDDHPPKQNK